MERKSTGHQGCKRRERSPRTHPRLLRGAIAHPDGAGASCVGIGSKKHADRWCQLPHQLARKYPSAPRLWQWFWIFPAASHCAHPRTGEIVRYHILHDLLQRAVRGAARKTRVEGLITPHVLRHAYATHSREDVDALRELMGHASILTTAGYRHPIVDKATNPLDDLLGR